MKRILGCPLFARQSRGLQLTRKGEQLFSYAESMYFGIVEFTHTTHAEMATNKKRKIRIAATHADVSSIQCWRVTFSQDCHDREIIFWIASSKGIDDVYNDSP